jgi:hypothetical protein
MATPHPAMTTRRSIALILSPVGLLLISAARLIVVADFNTTTAVTIASSGGFVNTLLGTVIPLVPLFMPYLALFLLLIRRFLLSLMTFVFAAFITPTAVSLPEVFSFGRAQWLNLAAQFSDYQFIIIVVVAAIIVALWAYNRSFAEALSIVVAAAVALVLLFAIPETHPSGPIRLASTSEHNLVIQASAEVSSHFWWLVLTALVIVVVLFVFLAFPRTFGGMVSRFSWLLGGVVAVIATIALLPYVNYIYPVPHGHNYYAEAAHTMWLPTEKIVLNNHHVYYGYILSSGGGWFTVLLANSRTIAYLSTGRVVTRSVCQPTMTAQPKQYPPLVPWLYHSPPRLPACARNDRVTLITSVRSKGESLREIALTIHRCPWTIISVTNAHEHEEPSAALRSYESVRDWNAPTPVSQRFWYYPRIRPGHYSCSPSHLSW